tara:strand:+ start:142 stop:336 length:195 start_codon:yes stop_codon:yes gene_type:complete
MSSNDMSPLAATMVNSLKTTHQHFHDLVDTHADIPWRNFLLAWGEIRAADILLRDDEGHYYIDI